jgi:putative (di)nucleoside polyphosphate hydrolase
MQDKTDLPYRPCVGIMLANRHGTVFVGQRIDAKEGDAWQMPQGGIDPGETAEAALIRELGEETGIAPHLVEKIADHPQQLRYDIPDAIAAHLWKGKYAGQIQDWYLARFTGVDGDVNIATDHPEFSHWQWVEPHLLPELIVPFKRDMYRAILDGFADHLG